MFSITPKALQHRFGPIRQHTGLWVPATVQIKSTESPSGVRLDGREHEPDTLGPLSLKTLGAALYIGPKIQEDLEALAPYLNLTVDYGVLWWIAAPLFSEPGRMRARNASGPSISWRNA